MLEVLLIAGLAGGLLLLVSGGKTTNTPPEIYVVHTEQRSSGCLLMGVFLLGALAAIMLLATATPQ